MLVAGWWFLGRGSGAPGKDFNSVEQRFVTAARTIPNATATVHRFLELDEFDAAVDAQVVVLQRSMREFQTIADGEDGEAAELAQDAVTNGERALRAIERFRAAITVSNDLVVAQKALDDLRAEVDDLESKVDKWNDL